MNIDLRYPLAVAFFRAWLLDDQSAFGAATEFASVQSAGEAEALAEELQALHDSTPIPLESISLEVGLTFKSEESCRFWLDDVIRGLCGLERKRGAGFVPPASAIDRGSRLDSCPALGDFLSVDLLEAIEQSAVERFQSRSSSEGVRQLVAEIRSVLEEEVLPIEEIETALGQYFASVNDARVWLALKYKSETSSILSIRMPSCDASASSSCRRTTNSPVGQLLNTDETACSSF